MSVVLESVYRSIYKLCFLVSRKSFILKHGTKSALSACISARSGSLDEIIGALYTLIATSMAMAVTSLLLGLKPVPEISYHEYGIPSVVAFFLGN
jgi:hypothetical protein